MRNAAVLETHEYCLSTATPKETEPDMVFHNCKHNGNGADGDMTTLWPYWEANGTRRHHAASILNFTETLLSVYARFTVK